LGTFHIEIYAIGQTPHDEILLLDGFFPKTTKSSLEPYIIESINKNLNRYYIIDINEN
jgi:hypothetical protein